MGKSVLNHIHSWRGRNKVLVPPAVSIALLVPFILSLDIGAFCVALPRAMHRYLDNDSSLAALLLIVFFLATASTVMIWGRLADRFGAKKIVLLGGSLYILGAVGAAGQDIYNIALVLRAIEGIGAAMLMSGGMVVLVQGIETSRLGRLQGATGVASSVGTILGALSGGWLCEEISWRAVFLLPVPAALILVMVTLRWRPRIVLKGLMPRIPRPDAPGSMLLFCWLGPLVFGFNQGDEMQWSSPMTIRVFGFAAVAFILWLFIENRSRYPLVDVSLLKTQRPLRHVFLLFGTTAMLVSGTMFFVPVFLQQSQQFDPTDIGWVIIAFPVTRLLMSPLAGIWTDRGAILRMMQIGLVFIFLGFFGLMLDASRCDVAMVIAFLIVLGVGVSLLIPTTTKWLMTQMPDHQKGMMAGLYQTINMVGSTMGVGVFEALYATSTKPVLGCRFVCLFAVLLCTFVFCVAFVRQTTMVYQLNDAG